MVKEKKNNNNNFVLYDNGTERNMFICAKLNSKFYINILLR